MAIQYVFNPFTGTFDAVDTASSSARNITSDSGEFAVDAGVNPNELVYASGSLAAAVADNASLATAPAIGLVLDKPTTTTATILFAGKISTFSGLTVGADYFIGTSGSIITAGSLPTASGSVIQKIGVAVSSTTLLLNIQLPVVL